MTQGRRPSAALLGADHHGPASVALDIPADASMVATARLVVGCLAAARRELSADRLDDLKLAVSEACANAIASYDPDEEEPRVVLSWTEDEELLAVTVTDRGQGYDGELGTWNGSGGLGVSLIRALVDEAHWEHGAPGTTVRMTLKCPRAIPDGD
ncbi:MAG: ATP-binding protein [Acidimicrobiales bacterium]